MSKNLVNLQDNFLDQVRKDNILVTVYLISGVQLKGIVRGFDSFTVVLESPGKPPQIVYKHAIASVVPARPVMGLLQREERPQPAAAESQPESQTEEPKPEE